MQEQTMKEMQSYDDFSLLLDEGTDESNRFELLLVSCVVKSGEIAKQFLGLLQFLGLMPSLFSIQLKNSSKIKMLKLLMCTSLIWSNVPLNPGYTMESDILKRVLST